MSWRQDFSLLSLTFVNILGKPQFLIELNSVAAQPAQTNTKNSLVDTDIEMIFGLCAQRCLQNMITGVSLYLKAVNVTH